MLTLSWRKVLIMKEEPLGSSLDGRVFPFAYFTIS